MRRRHMENVRQMAYEDSGTRLNNRHWLEKEGPKIVAELPERQQAGLSVVLFALHRMMRSMVFPWMRSLYSDRVFVSITWYWMPARRAISAKISGRIPRATPFSK